MNGGETIEERETRREVRKEKKGKEVGKERRRERKKKGIENRRKKESSEKEG